MSNVAAQARTASIHSLTAIDSPTYNDGWPFSGGLGRGTYTWLFGSETLLMVLRPCVTTFPYSSYYDLG